MYLWIETMLNKFAASCEKCAKRVAPGDGELRGEPSNWFTVCKDCSVKSKSVLRLDLYRSDDSLEIGNVIIDASSVGDLAFFKVKSAMQKSRVRRIGKNTKVFFCSVEELPDVVKALQTEDCEFVVTAAVRAAIEEHIQESEERLEIAKMHLEIMEKQLGPYWEKVGQRISGVPWKLRSYQRDGVIYLRSNPDGFLADDVGVGKTPTLLVSIPQNMGILIVAPRNAKSVWVDHINWWRPDLKCIMLKGKSGFRWPEPNEAVITTYDSLPDFVPNDETYEHLSMSQKTTPSDWWIGVDEKLRDMPEDIILIADEIHKVKSGKTSRHRKFKALSNMIQSVGGYIWPASGSPMQNNPDELWTILSVLGLAKKAYGSRTYFNEIFKDYYAGKRGEELKVPIEAVEGFRRVALRRNLADVATELPGKIWNSILVEDIDKETRRVLDDAWAYIGPILDKMKKEEAVNWLQKLMRSKEGQAYEHFMRARQALAIAKIPQMLELVEDMEENGEPVIIYSYHRAPIEVLEDRPGWAIITGNVSESRRAHIVRDFREGKLKGIGITVTSGSEAITLVKAGNKPAHNAIFVDLAFNPMVNEQAEGRLNRLGQTEVVIITRMVADHPIDARVMDILTTKSSVIHQTINAAAVKELPDRITPFKALLTLQVIGKKPLNPRRNAQTPLEKWAKEGLSKVKQFLSMDADAGPKFVSLMKSGGLTERQWAYAIDICKRYPKDVGVYVAPVEPVEEADLDG